LFVISLIVITQGLYCIKDIYSKGLFAAFLLLGLFTFSGNAFSLQSRQGSAPITWVISGTTYKVKEFKYPVKSQKGYKHQVVKLASLQVLNLSRVHSKEAIVSLKFHSVIPWFKTTVPIFYQVKTISQNGKNKPSII
jgi:hypothetical protein